MNLELSDQEARLVRAQLVRHIVELEDEITRTENPGVTRSLTTDIRLLRNVYTQLNGMLDSVSPPSGLHAAKVGMR